MGLILSLFVFCFGIVCGILATVAVTIHFLKKPNDSGASSSQSVLQHETFDPKKKDEDLVVSVSKSDLADLSTMIDHLEGINSPLKHVGNDLNQLYANKESSGSNSPGSDVRMKTIIDNATLTRMEKDFFDNIQVLKDHAKSIKGMIVFLTEISKNYVGFAKDLSKTANIARQNVNKNTLNMFEVKKEEFVFNNWWQSLQYSMDSIATDHEALGNIINDDFCTYCNNVHDEMILYEKRLQTEGVRHVSLIKENIVLFETKLRDRDKYKEKVKNTLEYTTAALNNNPTGDLKSAHSTSSISSASASLADVNYNRRLIKLKMCEENLRVQTKKLYEIQREFYNLMPRIYYDVQIIILKSVVGIQSQLMKLTDSFDKNQISHHNISKRMKLQLTNAALSLIQMIKEENKYSAHLAVAFPSETPGETGLPNRPTPISTGSGGGGTLVQGYEMALQRVLEGLLLQSQLRDIDSVRTQASGAAAAAVPLNNGAAVVSPAVPATGVEAALTSDSIFIQEDRGKLNMNAESTATLAACNPKILPELPKIFSKAIQTETCVWLNSFTGRVYRDIATSAYFHSWFCAKLAQMLNKGNRPNFIDEFKVSDVQFGKIPPLLMNIRWCPEYGKKKTRAAPINDPGLGGPAAAGVNNDDSPKEVNPNLDTDNAANEDPLGENEYNEAEFYAACNAEMAFRSGIKFTISTNVLINWPITATVPVNLHVDLSEVSGKIRFGVHRAYSFFSFIKDPIMRISVRSEVGSDKYKLNDIPQISDYIIKKIKMFIHNKIVYPSSHKFRLIWPRNWWPEGTENEFMPVPLSINVNGVMVAAGESGKPVVVVAPATAVPAVAVNSEEGAAARSFNLYGGEDATKGESNTATGGGTTSTSGSTISGLKNKFSSWYNKSNSGNSTTLSAVSTAAISGSPVPNQPAPSSTPGAPTSAGMSNYPALAPLIDFDDGPVSSTTVPLKDNNFNTATTATGSAKPGLPFPPTATDPSPRTKLRYETLLNDAQWANTVQSISKKYDKSPAASSSSTNAGFSGEDPLPMSSSGSSRRYTLGDSTDVTFLDHSAPTSGKSRPIAPRRARSITDFRPNVMTSLFSLDVTTASLLPESQRTQGNARNRSGSNVSSASAAAPSVTSTGSGANRALVVRGRSTSNAMSTIDEDANSTSGSTSAAVGTKAWLSQMKRENIAKAKAKFSEFKQKHFKKEEPTTSPTAVVAPTASTGSGDKSPGVPHSSSSGSSSAQKRASTTDRLVNLLFDESASAETARGKTTTHRESPGPPVKSGGAVRRDSAGTASPDKQISEGIQVQTNALAGGSHNYFQDDHDDRGSVSGTNSASATAKASSVARKYMSSMFGTKSKSES